MTSQTNSAAASIGKGKPEFPYLPVHLFDLGFFRPEGRVFGGFRLNSHHRKIFCIYPNSAAVKEFTFGYGFDNENVTWAGRHPRVPDQREAIVVIVEGYPSLILLAQCLLLALQSLLEHPVNHQVGTFLRPNFELL